MNDPADPLAADNLTPKLGTGEAERIARDQTPLPPTLNAQLVPGLPVPYRPAWTLVKEIGRGGFGEVWQAKHEWKKELGAVKFCTHRDARLQLASHEKKVIVRVMKYAGDHPHIVPLWDYNLSGDVPWLMYEYVEGGTLAEAVLGWRDLPLPRRLGRSVLTLYALARALKRVHRLDPPIVHRDLKPANILMARGLPRITDFGIGGAAVQAAVSESVEVRPDLSVRLPTMLKAMGTLRYASPEQMFGSLPDPRDDIYALGILGYQMMMGDLQTAPGTDAADSLRELRVPEDIISLIVKSVAMDPDRRPRNGREWERALRPWIPKKPHSSASPAPVKPHSSAKPEPVTRSVAAPPAAPPTARVPVPTAPLVPPVVPVPAPSSEEEILLEVPGTLSARPAGDPESAWVEVAKTPAEVALAPAMAYCLRVKEKVADRDLAGFSSFAPLAAIGHINLAWCEQITDLGLSYLKDCGTLQSLNLMGCKRLTNAGLAHLRGMTSLVELSLRWCALVTDAGLKHLKWLGALQNLDLMGCTQLTDAGLAHLKGLTELQRLNLRWCERLTDAGLVYLKRFTDLRYLSLWNCAQITDAGVAALKDALPDCEIER